MMEGSVVPVLMDGRSGSNGAAQLTSAHAGDGVGDKTAVGFI